MGVPTSEVGYTIATTRRETTKVHKNMWRHWGGGNIFLASKEIYRILRHPVAHHRVNNSSPLASILIKVKHLHALSSNLFKIFQVGLSCRFSPPKSPSRFSSSPYIDLFAIRFIVHDFHRPKPFEWWAQFMNHLSMYIFLQFPGTSVDAHTYFSTSCSRKLSAYDLPLTL